METLNFELEDNIIAGLLQEETQNYVLENVNSSYFSNINCKEIFEVVKTLSNTCDTIIDEIMILNAFGKEILYNIQYKLEECKKISVNIKNIMEYCKILHKRYMVQKIKEAQTIQDFEKLKILENRIENVESDKFTDTLEKLKQNLNKTDKTLIKTGFPYLDKGINISGGKFIILGGATGCGKTAFALNMVNNMCQAGKSVLYINLEMTQEELVNRIICLNAGLKSSPYEQSLYKQKEKDWYCKVSDSIKNYNLYFADKYETSCAKIAARAKYLKNMYGLDVIFVDYLGLIQENKITNSYERATVISRKLKLLANELNIPVICLVQLNRENKYRQNKKPKLSDIRDSGAIEQDADVVMFVHREFLYDDEQDENFLELIIEKNRCGCNKEIYDYNFLTDTQLIAEIP